MRKTSKNKTNKWLPAIAVVGGLLLFSRGAKAAGQSPATFAQPVIITSHDAVYDYKHENGVWFTRRKGSTTWINMQISLTPEQYNLAVSRLSRYL